MFFSSECFEPCGHSSHAEQPFFPDWESHNLHMSNEKRAWLFSVYRGMNSYPVMWGLFHKPWNKDPVIKQPVFHGKYPRCFFFSWFILHGVSTGDQDWRWCWKWLSRAHEGPAQVTFGKKMGGNEAAKEKLRCKETLKICIYILLMIYMN